MIIPFGFLNKQEVGTEIYTWSDAASPTGVTESNGLHYIALTEGWRTPSVRSTTVSTASESYLGTYSVEIVATSDFSAYCQFYFQGVIGKTYKISFWAKRGVTGTSQRVATNSGFVVPSGDILINSTTWEKYEYTGEASATTMVMFFYGTFNQNIGDALYVDNFSILEL